MKNKNYIKHQKDEVLKELWETKDHYSLSCNSNFNTLVAIIRQDIADIHWKEAKEPLHKKTASI